jgi:DNA-3-methyladenine glycosylase II
MAVESLREKCPELGRFIAQCGPLKLKVTRDRDLFNALAAAIVYQQLSGKAASTIHGRFTGLFVDSIPEANQACLLSMDALRGVGLSRNKALAILDLSGKSIDGSLIPLLRMGRMNDEAIVENLCQVRGIGPWTAQMFLLFNLGRPDVMPAADLGVQKGVQSVYALDNLPSPDTVQDMTAHLSPYRSAATWYFWRAADTKLMA